MVTTQHRDETSRATCADGRLSPTTRTICRQTELCTDFETKDGATEHPLAHAAGPTTVSSTPSAPSRPRVALPRNDAIWQLYETWNGSIFGYTSQDSVDTHRAQSNVKLLQRS